MVNELAGLDRELTRLQYKNISSGKIVAHLIYLLQTYTDFDRLLIEENDENEFLGIYLGNEATFEALKKLLENT